MVSGCRLVGFGWGHWGDNEPRNKTYTRKIAPDSFFFFDLNKKVRKVFWPLVSAMAMEYAMADKGRKKKKAENLIK